MTSTSLPPESLRFLDDLDKHNDKRWFETNRDRCERDLIAPAKALVGAPLRGDRRGISADHRQH